MADDDPQAQPKKNLTKEYNARKEYHGRAYTGMRVGRRHTWSYPDGTWREQKVTPDKWEFTFAASKRRHGHAPEGSGVPVGTEYHWYVLAHQFARKLDANTYDTFMDGLKFKVAHKRANSEKWSTGHKDQPTERDRVRAILEQALDQLDEVAEVEEPPLAEPSGGPRSIAREAMPSAQAPRKRRGKG